MKKFLAYSRARGAEMVGVARFGSAAIDAAWLTQIKYKPISNKLLECVSHAQFSRSRSALSCRGGRPSVTNGDRPAAPR
jgi:hypothetical protein